MTVKLHQAHYEQQQQALRRALDYASDYNCLRDFPELEELVDLARGWSETPVPSVGEAGATPQYSGPSLRMPVISADQFALSWDAGATNVALGAAIVVVLTVIGGMLVLSL